MVLTKDLKCVGCGNEFRGLWDTHGEGRTPDVRCPGCGSGKVRVADRPPEPSRSHFDTGNLFEVLAVGDCIRFRASPSGVLDNIGWACSQIQLPRELALNLAAWLALLADPTGKEFERIGEEIKKS